MPVARRPGLSLVEDAQILAAFRRAAAERVVARRRLRAAGCLDHGLGCGGCRAWVGGSSRPRAGRRTWGARLREPRPESRSSSSMTPRQRWLARSASNPASSSSLAPARMLSAGAAMAGLRGPVGTGSCSATKEVRTGSPVRRCGPPCARTTAVARRARHSRPQLPREYGLDFDGIVRLIYRDPADRQLLARLARTVMALDDDPVMTGILDRGCDYLVDLASVLRAKLGTGQPQVSRRSPCTAGCSSNTYVRGRFVAATGAQRRGPRSRVRCRRPGARAPPARRSDHGRAARSYG